MEDRDVIFREQLIALVTALNDGEAANPVLRGRIGSIATQLAAHAGAKSWADLKERADGATYDQLLELFQKDSLKLKTIGDDKSVRALEVLAISLIGRRQYQGDLLPGMRYVDDLIARSEALVGPRGGGPRPLRQVNGR